MMNSYLFWMHRSWPGLHEINARMIEKALSIRAIKHQNTERLSER
jgi:hypothetical protein